MSKNIVILTMGLEIGGAETHIMELACALQSKGHSVTVFSNGGVFVPIIEAQGIHHITAPMNTKNPVALIRSLHILKKYCKNNHVSVIHSHTRITNFIANLVCRKYKIPMVTTVHFNFKINFLTKRFSKWGSRALSVSEDLREYVSKGYGVKRDHVRITVNGINLNTFAPGSNPELRAKYNLNEEHKVILCVSRIDTGACENVFHFLESAEEIYKSVPNTRIVIVGNGNRFGELQQITANLNAATTENFVQLAGAQTNISEYCRMADAFAGVSRSALEAIACRIPTILIGNAGYLGVYSDEIKQACIDTNFTCRGYSYVSPHEVAEIMIGMLTSPEKYADNIEKAYRLVEEKYSVYAMADDALTSYAEAEDDMRPCDLMLSGYYGTHNFGDDVTLDAIIKNISAKHPIQNILILSHTSKNTFDDPRINVIHRFNLFKILPAMKKTKMFILGGGSLLQDTTSNRSIFFYLFMLCHAHKYGCRTMVYGNGIGPLVKERHKRNTLRILSTLDKITIRDAKSYDFLISNGLPESKVTLTADEAYNYNIEDATRLYNIQVPEGKKILLVNLRSYKKWTDISKDIAVAVNSVSEHHNLFPILLPAQFDQDFALLESVAKELRVEFKLCNTPLKIDEFISIISQSDYILTERLHPIVFATRMNKPFVCIVYDPKVGALAEHFKMKQYALPLVDINAECLEKAMENMIANQDQIIDIFSPIATHQCQAAKINSEIACDLLNS